MNDQNHAYEAPFTETFLPDEEYEAFSLSLDDDKLSKMLIDSLDTNRDYWNQKPWQLQKTDVDNTAYLLGEQYEGRTSENQYPDNRLFTSVRAILSYATGQLATPSLTPSRSDDQYVKMARAMEQALYQHSKDEYVDQKVKSAVMNLITRKRGFLKLRYDPNAGTYGDIVTENCNPEDIIIDRNAKFLDNPNIIYHRLRCSVDELCARFPKKEAEIKIAYSIKQGRYTQMSRFVTYFETWFTYLDTKNTPREGLAWIIPEHSLILDKMPNPNWVYTGDDAEDKQENVTFIPPKPFVGFNYLNTGKSYIDETCLFEQALPQQMLINRRLKQIVENADYANGRWVASKKAMSEEDGAKFINKGPKTLALVDAEDVNKAVMNESADAFPEWVYKTLIDSRNEVDIIMGTPSVFKGEQPSSQDTLGRDMMVKQQAGALQDDLVRSVHLGMERYYKIKLQLMRVYYTDDYWFQVKGGEGKFDFIMLNGDNIDANVKIGVQVDSTLPLDKERIRATSIELSKENKIDLLTLLEDLGVPNPEIRAERVLRSQLDPIGYLNSISQQIANSDAEVDIMLLIAGKTPEERDNYDAEYLSYFNHFVTLNRFQMLPPDAQQRITAFLMVVQHLALQTETLQAPMVDDAGMSTAPLTPPAPKKSIQVRVDGKTDPATATSLATGQPPPTSQPSQPPK